MLNVIGQDYPEENTERIHHSHTKAAETKAHDALTAHGNVKAHNEVA